MGLKVEKREGAREARILTAMIVSKSVLGRIAARWEDHLFPTRPSSAVGRMCVDYYKKHGDAPGAKIEALFEEWASQQTNREDVRLVEQFLLALSGEYENQAKELNPELILDLAGVHFNYTKLLRVKALLESGLESGNLAKAEKAIANFKKTELGAGAGLDLFTDSEEVKSLFTQEEVEVLVPYPDALGQFFRQDLVRDSLVGIMAPDKAGKSYTLQDIAFRALSAGRRVAYFEAGDLSKWQVAMRFMIRNAGRPFASANADGSWPCVIEVPEEMELRREEGGPPRAYVRRSSRRTFKRPLSFPKAWEACESLMQFVLRSKRSYFKLSVHSNSTLNVAEIKSTLEEWAASDWYPDVIVIDYADILAPPPGVTEYREQINTTWKQLRSVSQMLHCLVVTATQSDAAAYEQDILSRKNFSEDKRKLAHVSAMMGINVTDKEKERGVARFNWIVKREGASSASRCVHVAQCLALANPTVLSAF